MAEKITIAELDLDISSILQKYTDTRSEIALLRKEQKLLKDQGKENTKQFSENEIALASLSKEYNQQKRLLGQMTDENKKLTSVQETLTRAIDKEVVSIEQARKNNKELLALRNKLNLATEEGRKQADLLNEKLDENNKFIKENVSAYEQQKIGIGDYEGAIKRALPQAEGIFQAIVDIRDGLIKQKQAFAGATAGSTGLAKASKILRVALISTGIGAIAVAIGLVANALSRSEEATNKFKRVFAPLKGLFNGILSALQPIGEFLIDKIVYGFEQVGKVASWAIGIVSKGLKTLGFEEASKSVDNFQESISKTAKESQALADAEATLQKRQREANRLMLDYQKEAEKLRQIRDDESKDMATRIKANQDLGVVLQKQLKEEKAIAQLRLNVVNQQIAMEGRKSELLDLQAEALNEISDIEERITGQQSEQLINTNSLRREASDKLREIREKEIDALLEKNRQEIELFMAQHELKKSTFAQETEFLKQLKDKELEDLKLNYENKKLTDLEYQTAKLQLEKEFLDKQDALNKENIQKKLEEQAKLDEEKKIKEAVDLENRRILQEEEFQTDFEKQLFRLNLQEQAELESAEKTGANKKLIEEKFAKQRVKLEETKNDAIAQNNAETFALIGSMLGEASSVGKAVALFQAGINVQQGITKALAEGGFKGIFQAIAVATRGFSAIQKITSFSEPNTNISRFETGGLMEIGGRRHSAGGTKFRGEDGTMFEAERGELIGVMSRDASRHFMAFNNAFTSGKSSVGKYASGGLINPFAVRSNTASGDNELAKLLADQVNNIRPVLVVEDVTEMQTLRTEIVSGADI